MPTLPRPLSRRPLAPAAVLTLAALCLGRPSAARAAAPESLLDLVPENAVAAAALRRPALDHVRQWLDKSPALRADMASYLTRTLGVDATGIEAVVTFSTGLVGQAGGAVLLRLPPGLPGTLKGQPRGSHLGVPIVEIGGVLLAKVPPGLLVGTEADLKAGIAVALRKAPGLSARSPLGRLLAVDQAAEVVVGAHATALGPSAGSLDMFGIRDAVLSLQFDKALRVEVGGDPPRLDSARLILGNMVQAGIGQLRETKERAAQKDNVAEALGAMVSFHQATQLWQELQPKLVGDRLVSEYKLPDARSSYTTLMLPMAGVLAAIAIPSFTKYMQRSKAVEASANLRMMRTSILGWYAEYRGGKRFAFPPSTDWAPATSCCAKAGNQCLPEPAAWKAPAWKAFAITLDAPHRFQYRYTAAGKGTKARLTLEARGDLACDGHPVIYRVTGGIGPSGELELSEPELVGAAE